MPAEDIPQQKCVPRFPCQMKCFIGFCGASVDLPWSCWLNASCLFGELNMSHHWLIHSSDDFAVQYGRGFLETPGSRSIKLMDTLAFVSQDLY